MSGFQPSTASRQNIPRPGSPDFRTNPVPVSNADSFRLFLPIVKEPGGKIHSVIIRKTCQHLSRQRAGALYRCPGCDPVRDYRGILRFASAPGPPKSPLDVVMPVTRGQLSAVMSEILEHQRENTATVRRIRAFATALAGAKPNSPHHPAPARCRARSSGRIPLVARSAKSPPSPLPRRREHPKQTTLELKR